MDEIETSARLQHSPRTPQLYRSAALPVLPQLRPRPRRNRRHPLRIGRVRRVLAVRLQIFQRPPPLPQLKVQQSTVAPLLQRPRRDRQQVLGRLQRLVELPLPHARPLQVGQDALQNLSLRHPAQKRLRARARRRIRLPQPRRQLIPLNRPPAVKRIQIALPACVLVLHQKVKRRAHALQRDPGPPSHLQHDHRQRDRHPLLRCQRAVQAAVRRLVIRLRIAPQPMPTEQHLAQRLNARRRIAAPARLNNFVRQLL